MATGVSEARQQGQDARRWESWMLLGARRGVLGVKRLIKMLVVPVVQAGKVEIRMKSSALSGLSGE